MIDERKARRVIDFIQCLKHTKGEFHGKPFRLLPWQEKIIRDVFGTVREDDPTMRQYTTAYIEIPKKQGKSELGAAIALNMLVNDDEWKAEVYSCASDRQQAAIVFDVAVDMVKQSPALMKRMHYAGSHQHPVYQRALRRFLPVDAGPALLVRHRAPQVFREPAREQGAPVPVPLRLQQNQPVQG